MALGVAVTPRRVALVTGASRGIGRAVARRLAADGLAVALTFRAREADARRCVEEIVADGGEAAAFPFESGARTSARLLVEHATGRFGPPAVLVNNAARIVRTPFPEISDEEWDALLAANLRGPFQLAQECLPAMRARRFGRIVNVASIGGQTGGTLAVHYAA